jgi:hypothetical protein
MNERKNIDARIAHYLIDAAVAITIINNDFDLLCQRINRDERMNLRRMKAATRKLRHALEMADFCQSEVAEQVKQQKPIPKAVNT